jgi:hypothetical protein
MADPYRPIPDASVSLAMLIEGHRIQADDPDGLIVKIQNLGYAIGFRVIRRGDTKFSLVFDHDSPATVSSTPRQDPN